jgi:dihydrolipoamide dehydrogenase
LSILEVRVPDLGDAKGVTVVDVLVAVGAKIDVDAALITLETEKASMDVPSPVAGVVASIEVRKGQEVATGTLIATVTASDQATRAPAAATPTAATPAAATPAAATPAAATPAAATPAPSARTTGAAAATPAAAPPPEALELVVLGAGPGGYTAAFRAADLGLKVTLIERWPVLGGVCLNVGCIPSKALLHAAKVIEDAADMKDCGIVFAPPQIDRDALRAWKNRVLTKLTNGLTSLAKQRKVEVLRGEAKFVGPYSLAVQTPEGTRRVDFKQCIIAAGSESVRLPGLPDDPRIIDSTGALELPLDCKRLLVIGGGIIGLEMACVYDALGATVTVVELSDGLMPGTDRDLVRPLQKRIDKRYQRILLKTRVSRLEAGPDALRASFEGPDAPEAQNFDRVLVAVGRSANGNAIDAAAAGVAVDARGIIAVDKQMRSNVPHIFAIGDIAGGADACAQGDS